MNGLLFKVKRDETIMFLDDQRFWNGRAVMLKLRRDDVVITIKVVDIGVGGLQRIEFFVLSCVGAGWIRQDAVTEIT